MNYVPHVMSYSLTINILFAKAISTLFEDTQMAHLSLIEWGKIFHQFFSQVGSVSLSGEKTVHMKCTYSIRCLGDY